jgi:shikimate dehydrogenase
MKTFALLGHPVGHSVSPAIHHAAYSCLGLDHRYVAIDCPDADAVREQKNALARGDLGGVNITVPWKTLALRLADEVDESARRTGACNVWVRRDDGKIVAHNTDTSALAERLQAGLSATPSEGFSALVLGAGGAARAAVVACLDIAAHTVFVSSRKWRGGPGPGLGGVWEGAEEFRALGATPIAWCGDVEGGLGPRAAGGATTDIAAAALGCRLIVQATSAGMRGAGAGDEVADIVPWSMLPERAFAYDLVYNPAETPFLKAAAAHRISSEGGLSMLVGQAAFAFELWLGLAPDRERMHEAAHQAIFGAKP